MFCYNCGKEIPADGAFCAYCGAQMQPAVASESQPEPEPEYTLTLDRASQLYLINPPIKALINNSIRLNIENGQTQSIKLPPGVHTADFSSSFRKRSIEFELNRDMVIELKWNRITGQLVVEIKS